MCTIAKHEETKNDPARLAATTEDPQPMFDRDGSIMHVMRRCILPGCGSTLCVTQEQEAAVRGVLDTGSGG